MSTATLSRPDQGAAYMAAEKPFLIELPDDERGRDERDLRILDIINARLAKPPKARDRMSAEEARKKDLELRDALERAPAMKAEAKWARDTADETARLAEARGAETAKSPSGRLEIISHDPLRRLLNSGKLTSDQHEAGEALRDCYDARAGDAGSQLAELAPTSTGHDNHQFVATRFTRALATDRAAAVEIAVLTGGYRLRPPLVGVLRIEAWEAFKHPEAPPPHVALTVLRSICAHNIGLTDQGRGRAFERNSKALLIALDITHECLMGNRAKR